MFTERVLVFSRVPIGEAWDLEGGRRFRRIWAIVVRVSTGERNLTPSKKRRERSNRDEHWRRRKEREQHRNQEWETTMYRRATDVSKDTGPALGKYGWEMTARDVTWAKHKNMTNVQACVCLSQEELLGILWYQFRSRDH